MDYIAGEQTLLNNNIFPYKSCNLFKTSNSNKKIHSLMPEVSNWAILLLSTRSFHFCYAFCFMIVLMIDKVTCHAKSQLVGRIHAVRA